MQKIPNNIIGCIKLLIKNFPEKHCSITKRYDYYPMMVGGHVSYSVYVEDVGSNLGLRLFSDVRSCVGRLISESGEK